MMHKAWLTAWLSVAVPGLVFAQATATINGRVIDQVGAVLPGATITITNTSIGVTRESVTNAEGLYSVPALDPGTYDIRAALSGFAPAVKNGVGLLTGSTLTVDFALGLAQLQETVTVAGQVPLVETTQSVQASSIRQSEVAQLPMLNRSLAAMITLLPGAREVPASGSHGNASSYVSFNGGSGRNFNMLVDGVDNHDEHDGGTAMVYSLEGVQEFRVFKANFTAEYGKEATTIVLATKSGTNQLHGSLFGFGRNQALTTSDYFSQPAHGGLGKQPFNRAQYGGAFGGPLVKNRAWFFGSVERIQQDYTLPRPNSLYRELEYLQPLNIGAVNSHEIFQPYRDLLTQVKTNLQVRQNHSIFARASTQNSYVNNGFIGTGRALLACCPIADKNGQIMANGSMGWSWILNPTTVNQVAVQYLYFHHDEVYANPCDTSSSNCLVERLTFPSVSTGPLNGFPHWHNRENKIEIKDDLSKQVGNHSLKFGVDYQKLPLLGGINGLGSPGGITFFDDPSVIVNNTNGRYPDGFQTPGIVRSIALTTRSAPNYDVKGAFSFATYAQDDFKVAAGLTLNLGLRYEVYEFMGQPELDQNRTYQVLKAIGSPFGRLPKTDRNNVAPRFGAAWDMGRDGTNVLRAGFGLFFGQGIMNTYLYPTVISKPVIYFQQTFTNSAIGSGQLANYVYGVTPLPTVPLYPTQYPAGQSVGPPLGLGAVYDPDLQDSVSRQASVGFSHVFARRTVLAADYTHILGLHGWRTININPLLPNPVNPGGPRIRPLSADTQRVYGDANLLGPLNVIASLNRSLYDEVAVHLEHRFSQSAAFQTNYTLAWARGMGGVTDGTTGGPLIPPQTPSATGGDIYAPWEWGPSAFDERHRITVAGVFNLPFQIDVSPSFTAASARPYTHIAPPTRVVTATCSCSDPMVIRSD
jgi:hypothetical protein